MATSVGAISIAVNYALNKSSVNQINASINNLKNQGPQLQNIFVSAFGKVGSAISSAFSVENIVSFSKEALKLASDLEEVQNVVDVTFGSMSETVNAFAKVANFNLGMSETTAKRYASAFGAMAKSAGYTTEEATRMGVSLTKLSADVASLYNYDYDEIYTKMKTVFTGMTAPLRDIGVDITLATLDAWALAKGYTKTTEAMTQQEKVALRYAYVIDQMRAAEGDYLKTNDHWANQMRSLREQINQFLTSIGNGLLIILGPAIQTLNSFMIKLNQVASAFASFVSKITGKKLENSSQAKAQAQINAIGMEAKESSEDLGGLAKGYENAGSAAKKATESLAKFDNVVQLTDDSSSGSGGAGSGAGGIGDYTAFEDYNPMVESAFQPTVFDSWIEKLEKIKKYFSNLIDIEQLKADFSTIGTALSDIAIDVKPTAEKFVKSFVGYIVEFGHQFLSVGANIAQSIVGGVSLYLSEEKGRIAEQWVLILENTTGYIENMTLLIHNFGTLLSTFFSLETTRQALANAFTAIEGTISGTFAVISLLYEELSMLISKTIDENFGELTVFVENTSTLLSQLTQLIKNIVKDCFSSIYDNFDKYVRPAFEQFQEGFSYAFGKVVEVWNTYIHPLLQTIATEFNDLWSNHLSPFVNQVLGMAGAFIEMVATVYNQAIRPFIDNWAEAWDGISIILGFIVGGVSGAVGNVIDALGGLATFVKGLFETLTGIITGDSQKIKQGVENIFTGLLRTVGALLTSLANTIIGGVNGVIKTINKIKIPGTEGANIPEIKKFNVNEITANKLADGGIVYRETNFGNFIAGEAGAEAIVPLENSHYTKVLAREIVNGIISAGGFGGDTYNIENAFGDDRSMERLVGKIAEKQAQIGARKGGVVYGY